MVFAWAFDPVIGPVGEAPVRAAKRASARRQGEPHYLCALCAHPITNARDETRRKGLHLHCYMNPAGFVYRIACFGAAPGTAQIGEPTDQHSWFPGFTWRICLCGNCREHLGWSFAAEDGDGFFGLIVDRLVVSMR